MSLMCRKCHAPLPRYLSGVATSLCPCSRPGPHAQKSWGADVMGAMRCLNGVQQKVRTREGLGSHLSLCDVQASPSGASGSASLPCRPRRWMSTFVPSC